MKESDYKRLLPQMRELRRGSILISYAILFINFSLFASGLFLISSSNIYYSIAGIFILAFQMNHAYMVMHECGHATLIGGKKTNLIIGHIIAFTCVYPFEIKKHEHMLHHRCTGGFDEPVAKKAMQNFSLASPFVDKLMKFCWKFWVPVFTANEIFTTWRGSFRAENKQWKITSIVAVATYLALGAYILQQPNGIFFLLKVFASIYLYMIALEFFTMPHHVPSIIDQRNGPVPFHEQDKYTQSCTPWPDPLNVLLMLNVNYHVVHHLYPYVHFTRLKEAHALIGSCEPAVLETRSEWDIMLEIRRRGFQEVFEKYYQEQHA